jgi:chemotaxis protein MotB
MRKPMHVAVLVSAAALATACGVPQTQYDALSKQEQQEKADAAKHAAELEARIKTLEARVKELESTKGEIDAKTRAELDELRKQKELADARSKLLDDFVRKFKSMIDAGKLAITTRHGQLVLQLATDVLFDAGRTDIKPEGKAALGEVAAALKTVTGRRFQVAGHTDSSPIHTKEFPSNWELSTARAVSVVKLLVKDGVKADEVSAAGYAEFDPVQNNSTPKGKAQNRRIEIVLVPNIEELVKMPELKPEEHAATPPHEPPPPPHHPAKKPKKK